MKTQTIPTVNLKSCPFCAAPDRRIKLYKGRTGWIIVCLRCGVSNGLIIMGGEIYGKFESELKAVNAWNQRR